MAPGLAVGVDGVVRELAKATGRRSVGKSVENMLILEGWSGGEIC